MCTKMHDFLCKISNFSGGNTVVPDAYFHFIPGQKHKPVSHAPLAVRRATELLVAMPAGIGSPQAQCRRKILQAAVSGGLQNLWYRPKISYYSQRWIFRAFIPCDAYA